MASWKEQLPCSKLLHVLPENTQTLKERLAKIHVKTAFQVNILSQMQQFALCVHRRVWARRSLMNWSIAPAAGGAWFSTGERHYHAIKRLCDFVSV
jgi:hypothetical protein